MNIRDRRQLEYANLFLKREKKIGVLLLSVRMGKTRVGLNILRNYLGMRTLVCYPDNKIRGSWEKEAGLLGFSLDSIEFCNFSSLHKFIDRTFDILVVDECHELSDNQIMAVRLIQKPCKLVLGLTGTLMPKTKSKLRNALKWPVIAEYTTEQAIEDGIIADYHITIHRIPLDTQQLINYNGKYKTEQRRFNDYSYIIMNMEEKGRPTKMMRLNRMRVLQASVSKQAYVIKLLQKLESERVMVFSALSAVADSLGIPSEHSKNKSNAIEMFMNGEIDKCSVVDMAFMGTTFTPLHRAIINYVTSNAEDMHQRIARALNLDYEGKVALLDIICSTENTELEWLKKALINFDNTKITYL